MRNNVYMSDYWAEIDSPEPVPVTHKIRPKKPHSHYAGYQFERKYPQLNAHLVCVNASEANLDAGSKYVVLLEAKVADNSRIGPDFSSLKKARKFAKDELSGQSAYDWAL